MSGSVHILTSTIFDNTGTINGTLGVSLTELESRTQGSRPRPRTQKKSEAKDSLSEDRHTRGQGQNARGQGQGPRTQAQVLSKKKGLHKNFLGDLKKKKKKVFTKNFSSDLHKKTFSKKFFKRFTKF